MKIAITAYVDNFEKEKYADECNLMTYSGQSLDDRFTFVIYAHPESLPLIDLYENVIVIPYVIEDEYYSSYKFAKSLNFVHINSEFLLKYNFIIKTDTDVIFTPQMNNFNFNENIISIGEGHYTVSNKSVEKLKEVAKNFGYPTYKRISDMHSTIICNSKDMIDLMRLSDLLCKEIYYGIPEPGEWGSDTLWRGDYGTNSGICSMYALEIILSSNGYSDRVQVTNKIDAGSEWKESYKDFYHYHCYHHDNIYSKHQSKFGSYKNLKKQSGNSSAAYCINQYIERRDLGINNPDKFNKPNFTIFQLPDSYEGPRVWYVFDKEVD
jgi:hypothetical protein